MIRAGLLAQLAGLLFIVVGGNLAVASGPVLAAPDPITGQVVASLNHHPLIGICVLFDDTGSDPPALVGTTQSGVDGSFSFRALPAHAYDVGFFAPSRPGDCSSSPVATSPAPAWYRNVALSPSLVPPVTATPVAAGTQNLDVCLGPRNSGDGCVSIAAGGTITGTVLTVGGIPEPGACIVVFAASMPTGPFGGAITDAQGTYTLGGLPDATDLTAGFVPPFTGPGGPCDLSMPPPAPPPGALQPVWSGNVFFNLDDPALGPNPYAASLAQGAQIVHTGDTVDACLTNALATQVPRPPCVPAAIPVEVTPRFTG
jgi:hypothetical protein